MKLLCIGRSLGRAGANLSGGGVLRVQSTLLDHLRRSGFDLTLFYLNRVEHESPAPCGLVPEFGAPGESELNRRMPGVFRRLIALARESDIVFGMQDGRPIDLAIVVGRLSHRPVVGWIHNLPARSGQDFPGGHPWITRHLYPRANRLVAVSSGIAEDLVHWSPRSARNVVSLPNPVNVAEVRRLGEPPPPHWARAIFARPTIVGMGWLTRRKGFDMLLESFAKVVRTGHDANLLLLGEGEERAALETQAGSLGLHDRVFMPGYHPNPYPLLSRAEAFVLSSRHEGLPTVILEAMSLGVPVVAFDCPFGPADILDGGRCGLLVPAEQPDAMADAISNLLASVELREHFRDLGLERAMQYDTSVVTKRFEALFLDLIKDRHQQKH
jgi:glycosyltransferase involved in cell wall biosynthesis